MSRSSVRGRSEIAAGSRVAATLKASFTPRPAGTASCILNARTAATSSAPTIEARKPIARVVWRAARGPEGAELPDPGRHPLIEGVHQSVEKLRVHPGPAGGDLVSPYSEHRPDDLRRHLVAGTDGVAPEQPALVVLLQTPGDRDGLEGPDAGVHPVDWLSAFQQFQCGLVGGLVASAALRGEFHEETAARHTRYGLREQGLPVEGHGAACDGDKGSSG
jgi:hypothetical protein